MANIYTSNEQRTSEVRQRDHYSLSIMFYSDKLAFIDRNIPFDYSITGGDFNDYHQQSIEILDKLRKHVEKKGYNLKEDNHDFTKQLSKVGLSMYNTIFAHKDIRELIATRDKEAENDGRGLQLMLIQPLDFKPIWELLYAGDPFDPRVKPDLFWGARYPLGRDLVGIPSSRNIKLGEGLLAAMHSELDESCQEIQCIAQLLSECSEKKKLMWLEKLLPEKEKISFQHLMKLFIEDSFGYGIIHLACHFKDPHDEGATKAYLQITVHNQQLEISLLDLTQYVEYPFHNQPFFFLNACETQMLAHPMQSLGFPTNLLKLKAGGVIATSCIIPDNFASVFAKEFYQRLFQKYRRENQEPKQQDRSRVQDQYIADVLMETRRFFLEEYNNPLGLAYGLYARTDQRFLFY